MRKEEQSYVFCQIKEIHFLLFTARIADQNGVNAKTREQQLMNSQCCVPVMGTTILNCCEVSCCSLLVGGTEQCSKLAK